jgi:hypothetical protein
MIFWNFACFGEILSLFLKPNRTNPENSGNTDGPIRKVPDRVWRKLKTLALRRRCAASDEAGSCPGTRSDVARMLPGRWVLAEDVAWALRQQPRNV